MSNWYRRWFSEEGYLGLHLVVGFFLALIAGLLFQLIADEVFGAPGARTLDARAQAFATSVASPGLTAAMYIVTFFGNRPALVVLSAFIGLTLYFRGSHRRLYTFGAIVCGGGLLNVLLKNAFHRSRPPEFNRLVEAYGYSFPSGHSMGSMLFFGGLAYVVFFTIERHPVWRFLGLLFCLLAVLLIGGSRIYLGVHYLSDVIAGFVAGLGWIGICVSGTEAWVRWRDRRRRTRGRDTEIEVEKI